MKTRPGGGMDRKGTKRLILFAAPYAFPYVAYNIARLGKGLRLSSVQSSLTAGYVGLTSSG